MRIKACAVKEKALFGTEWILRPNIEETMPDTVKPLAATLPCPPAQIPFSPDGIIQHCLSPGKQQTQGITWSQDRLFKECCFRSKNHTSSTLEESQMSMLYLCQLLAGDPSLTTFPRGLHG